MDQDWARQGERCSELLELLDCAHTRQQNFDAEWDWNEVSKQSTHLSPIQQNRWQSQRSVCRPSRVWWTTQQGSRQRGPTPSACRQTRTSLDSPGHNTVIESFKPQRSGLESGLSCLEEDEYRRRGGMSCRYGPVLLKHTAFGHALQNEGFECRSETGKGKALDGAAEQHKAARCIGSFCGAP